MDKMLIYVRLFLGMGITWYFEIINFALDPHPHWTALTDTLNMCQVCIKLNRKAFANCFIFSGSLGVHHLCLQEKCLESGAGQVEDALQEFVEERVL